VSAYPWYEESPPSESLSQGDILESFPVPSYRVQLQGNEPLADLPQILSASEVIEPWRALVMTQACDLAQKKVKSVVLCALTDLATFKESYIEARRQQKGAASPEKEESAWKSWLNNIREGRLFQYALLQSRSSSDGTLGISIQVVDFNQLACLPLSFVEHWLKVSGVPRLRLLPPYREHIGQSFARFFMRIGLPQDIAT